jgi:hypothetical protein
MNNSGLSARESYIDNPDAAIALTIREGIFAPFHCCPLLPA